MRFGDDLADQTAFLLVSRTVRSSLQSACALASGRNLGSIGRFVNDRCGCGGRRDRFVEVVWTENRWFLASISTLRCVFCGFLGFWRVGRVECVRVWMESLGRSLESGEALVLRRFLCLVSFSLAVGRRPTQRWS